MMKKLFFFVAMVWAAVQFSYAGNVITQDEKQLPEVARQFIHQYFGKPQISYIKIESEILQSKKYEVLLADRTELEFDSHGNWLEVDCKKKAVPAALIPDFVTSYVKANFPHEIVTKIKNKRGTEVELSNDLSFRFNKAGKLVEADD